MEKRTEAVVENNYKIFNLLLELPFLRIYQMMSVTDRRFYLLLDCDKKNAPAPLQMEMDLWEKAGGLPFPRIIQNLKTAETFSFIVPQTQQSPLTEFFSTKITPHEEVLIYTPRLVDLFQKLYELQISISDSEFLTQRISYTADQKFEILPTPLYHLKHAHSPFPPGLKKNGETVPVAIYTKAIGIQLCYLLTRFYPTEGSLPPSSKKELPLPVTNFLEFLISGQAESFKSVLENLTNVKTSTQKEEKVTPEIPVKPPTPITEQLGTFGVVFRQLFILPILLIRMLGFLFYLVGSYYWERIKKLGQATWKFYRRLRSLTLADIKAGFRKAVSDFRQEIVEARLYLSELNPLRDTDLLNFTRYLGVLLHAGVPLARSLLILHQQTDNPRLKRAVHKVYTSVVQGGTTMAAGFAASPRIFSELYVNMVSIGEISGKIDTVLHRLAEYLDASFRLRRKVKAAVRYPLVIAIACIGLFLCFTYFILPKFIMIFEGLSMNLPWPTRVLILLVEFAHSPSVIFLTILIAILVLFPLVAFVKKIAGKERIDYMKLQIPIFGKLYKKILLARFCSTFASLLDCGVPLLRTLDATGKAAGNEYFNQMLTYAAEEVRVGVQLGTILGKFPFFPQLFLSMIKVGEDTGQLGPMLFKIGDIYEDDVTYSLQQFLALIEPLLMFVMGIVVGFVVIAIFLPVYAIVSGIH